MSRIALVLVVLVSVLLVVPAQAPASGLSDLQALSDGMAELSAMVKPAVVAIKTEIVEKRGGRNGNPFEGTPLEDFLRSHPFLRVPQEDQRREGLGSGVIVSADGYILTNNHVITGRDRDTVADRITVELADRREFRAEVVGRDPLSDVAVLKVDADDLPHLEYGESEQLRVGEIVLAVGNPFGQLNTVTSGIVSALGREVGIAHYEDFIQTDAAINPGNSGGALVNTRGELVGINTAIIGSGSAYQGNVGSAGVGFAIPIDMARSIMGQLVEHGEVRRGFLGVYIQDIDPAMVDIFKLDSPKGVLVTSVNEDGPADQAGVEQEDVIVAVDGEPTDNMSDLQNRVALSAPGSTVELTVVRDGRERRIRVELGQLDTEQVAGTSSPPSGAAEAYGFEVQTLTPEIASRLGFDQEVRGVVVSRVDPGSEAARQLARRDVIEEVNREPVTNVREFREAIEAGQDKDAVLLLVRRQTRSGEQSRFVALRTKDN